MKISWKLPIIRNVQMLGRSLGCTTRKVVVLASLLASLLLLGYLLRWDYVCVNLELSLVVSSLCAQHEAGLALGAGCREICQTEALRPESCQAWHGGKEVVFSASLHGNPVFVKGRRLDFTADKEEDVMWKDSGGQEHYPSPPEFKEMVKNHLMYNLNISWEENTLYKLWPYPLQRESLTKQQNKRFFQTTARNIWALLLDNEYVFSRLYEHYDIFPELYGTCGGFYIVERLAPIELPGFMDKPSFSQWSARAKLALSIMDLLQELDTMFDHTVHLCDVKGEHFGVSEHRRVKFIDVDNVYLKPIIDSSIGDGSPCNQHTDCDFFDCRGQCDLMRGVCAGGVINDNLQVVCEKVFLGQGRNMISGGLLESRHSTNKLRELLKVCANPTGTKTGERVKTKEATRKALYKSLEEIIEFSLRQDD